MQRLTETPVLRVQDLTVRYGGGCPHCAGGGALEKNRCPVCGTVAVREWAGAVYSATGKPAPHCSGNCKTCSGCK